ncbi:hypothetical protein [Phyllobacterium zundukense]|uniref:EF-hand domain-containing protein n=1 Tax=Phyllobacterium zundukense TaxID=1867719 RepID=A0A2N9VU55_9HYPH|nr:hypothetical protein [Phyllobacterium zundukense]ATU93032.1 hypothetical protein BLM14_16480 [Phyllobacterium zundukense]PIO43023.1 hypothetical protein B5P45_21615 [Phyllobacterium zundukense]
MKKFCFLSAAAFAVAAFLPASVLAGSLIKPVIIQTSHPLLVTIADGMAYPPPPGTVRPEFNQENVQAEADLQLQEKYDAATKNGAKPLTAERANAVGWGFIADSFAAIDSNRNGIASLVEISAYLDSRSAVPIERKASSKVRIIE